VVSDPFLLRRVLQNFLSNAIRYTAVGGVMLRARRRGERITIYVIDTGVGIPRALQAEVFREYRQYVGADRVARVGLGLGLAIAKRIASLLEHRIQLRSAVGKGSIFSITVPAGERLRVQVPPAPAPALAGSFVGKTVLCVEDEAAVLGGLEALLASWGCETRGYQDGTLAVNSATGGAPAPHLLIVDYHLQNRDKGLEVAYRLNAIWRKEIPIIVLTAADLQAHDIASGRGIVRLIRKPIRPGALRALMDVVMS
jgi:CheY-like chemotaxis protein